MRVPELIVPQLVAGIQKLAVAAMQLSWADVHVDVWPKQAPRWFPGKGTWAEVVAALNDYTSREGEFCRSLRALYLDLDAPITRYVVSDWDGKAQRLVFSRSPSAVQVDSPRVQKRGRHRKMPA